MILNNNQAAFLQMIAVSELGQALIGVSDGGFNVIVGSTAHKPILFDSYADHPRKLVHLTPTLVSTAAGKFQLLARYFDAYKKSLNLPDFSPDSQERIALQQIKERGALPDVNAGNFNSAVDKCCSIWASLPGSQYGQHTNKLDDLRAVYLNAGGTLA
jgi:muramidase (phage lysozyme)